MSAPSTPTSTSFLASSSNSSSSVLGSTTDESQLNDDWDGCWKQSDMDQDHCDSGCYGDEAHKPRLSPRPILCKAAPGMHSPKQRDVIKRRRQKTCSSVLPADEDGVARTVNPRDATDDSRINAGDSSDAARRMFDRVAAIHWVDGGNGCLEGSFPTNPACLASLVARPNLAIRVHGTPYQWRSPCRPWLAFEADAFLVSLKSLRRDAQKRYQLAARVGGDGDDEGDGMGSSGVWRDSRGIEISASGNESVGNTSAFQQQKHRVIKAHDRGRFDGVCNVKRSFYLEKAEPSLEVHFQALQELDPE